MSLRILISFVGVFFLFALLFEKPAQAQFPQYTLPGGPEQRPESREDRLRREMAQARYHLGPVRIAPVAGFKNFAYVRNLFASEGEAASDVTLTVGAGFRAYLRTGPKMVWIADALPEYVWWRKRTGSRRLDSNFAVEGLGFFNRLTLDVAARRTEAQQIVTPEVPQPVNAGSDQAQVDAELRLFGTLFPFATARWGRMNNLLDDLRDPRLQSLSLLDRREKTERAGVRWRPSADLTVGIGAERSQVDFDREAVDSSNSGTAPTLDVLYSRRRFFFQTELAERSLSAREGSRFVDFDGVTGSAAVSVRMGNRVEAWTYASRNLVYSLSSDYPYLDDRRLGVSVTMEITHDAGLRLFAETGSNDYVLFNPAAPRRRDDVKSFGGSLQVALPGAINLLVQAVRTRFDSNLPGAGRTYTSGGLSLTLGGNL